MKQLRKTIRKILLENQQHYEKLAKLILTGEKESIVQALELAEAIGYISFTNHHVRKWHAGNYDKWSCNDCDPQFMEELEKQYHIETSNRIIPNLFSIGFYPERGYIAISLSEVAQ